MLAVMKWDELAHEPCSMARTLGVLGDRWTLLILRDCFLGVRRFDEFEERLRIARHVLASRLKKLSQAGILAKMPYQERPRREEYRLTQAGLDLYPVIVGLAQWGDRYLCGGQGPAMQRRHRLCGHVLDAVLTCPECAKPVIAHEIAVEAGPGAAKDFAVPFARRRG